jgi:hypothetical protein
MYCSSFHIGKKIESFEKCATEYQGYEHREPRFLRCLLTTLDSVTVGTSNRTWRILATVSWVGLLFCQAAVAVTSRNIGKSAWWLGPEGNPQFPLVWFTPFAIIVIALVATQRPKKFTIIIHLVCVALLAAVATGDVVDSPGVAALQYGVAAIALLVSFVSMAARP